MSVRIIDAYPERALTLPGQQITVHLELEALGDRVGGTITAQMRTGAKKVVEERASLQLETGMQCLRVVLAAPDVDAHGYEILVQLEAYGSTHSARTAALVASSWRQAPRYGFLSEFEPGQPHRDRIKELGKYHINVVQFYDWMYRHYQFLPPEDAFEDAMGRKLSLETVRQRVAECHSAGMATLAYGAVYGAEPEFVEKQPELVLRNARGEKLSLIDLFYITDLRAGSPWREHILQEFEGAVRDVDFDGIHMDQYGFPKWSYDSEGKAVNLAEQFPSLIDDAARRVAEQRESAAVLFNCVNNWPLEQVAGSDQAAVYIEVWPPHEHYRDLVGLIRRGRDLSGKQVVLAAYLDPFKQGGQDAEQAALLATAVIASAGGFHLLLGEGEGVLRDPYYPNHGCMSPELSRRMRRYYDHTAANHHYLFDEGLQDVTTSFLTGINEEFVVNGVPTSAYPEAGRLWVNLKQRENIFVINFVNLVNLRDTLWNSGKDEPSLLHGLSLNLSSHFRVERVVWSSPDEALPARELAFSDTEVGTSIPLPELFIWSTIVVEVG